MWSPIFIKKDGIWRRRRHCKCNVTIILYPGEKWTTHYCTKSWEKWAFSLERVSFQAEKSHLDATEFFFEKMFYKYSFLYDAVMYVKNKRKGLQTNLWQIQIYIRCALLCLLFNCERILEEKNRSWRSLIYFTFKP